MKPPFLPTAFLLSFVALTGASAGDLQKVLDQSLVRLEQDALVPLKTDEALKDKKIVAFYFSAHWCPPCRAFTPELSAWYDGIKAAHPEFELVFVSSDKDAAAMKEYMAWGKMNFPAVAFDKVESNKTLSSLSASGIPYLVVVDDNGKQLLGKGKDEDWRSPGEVLEELKKLLKSPKSGA